VFLKTIHSRAANKRRNVRELTIPQFSCTSRSAHFLARILLDLDPAGWDVAPRGLCFGKVFFLFWRQTRTKARRFFQRREHEKKYPPAIFRLSHAIFVSWRTHDATPPRPTPAPEHDESEYRVRQNFGMEQRILGSILLDNAVLDEAIKRGLTPEHFFNEDHQKIFAAMLSLSRQGKPIGDVTLALELQGTFGDNNEVSVLIVYASGLAKGLPDYKLVEQARHAVGCVKNESALRKLAIFCTSLMKSLRRQSVNAAGLVKVAQNYFQSIEHDLQIGEAIETPALTLNDMPVTVLDGRLGEFCQQRLLPSGLPLAYAWPALFTIAGGLVPPSGIRANLYTALVGPMGSAKSEAEKRSATIMGIGRPILQDVKPGSAEGLLENFGNADGEARIVNVDELRHLMEKAKIQGASFPYILNTSFYETQYELTIAHGKRVPVNCRLSLIGGVVKKDFEECFGAATTGGLYDRFIFGECPQPFEFLWRPFEGGAETTEPCSVEIAPDVWAERDEWVRTIPGLTPRLAELALRVAVICASFDGRGVLRAKDLKATREFAIYQTRIRASLKPNPGQNDDAKCAHKVLSALPDSGAQIDERTISKQIHSEDFGPGVFRHTIDNLRANGEIEKSCVGRKSYIRKII
jgi:hypothetical protein